jgi:hypothetical protein
MSGMRTPFTSGRGAVMAAGQATILTGAGPNIAPQLAAASYPGHIIYGADGAVWLSDGTRWRKMVTDDIGVTVRDADVLVTVGAGGDFATIGAALGYLARFAPPTKVVTGITPVTAFSAEVRILAGTVISETLRFLGVDLGWVVITSVDATVNVDLTAVWNQRAAGATRAEFISGAQSNMPVTRTKFVGINNPGGSAYINGVRVEQGSDFSTRDPRNAPGVIPTEVLTGFCGFHENVFVGASGEARLWIADLDDAISGPGVRVEGGGVCNLRSCNVRRSFGSSVLVSELGMVQIDGASTVAGIAGTRLEFRKTAGADSASDIVVASGGLIAMPLGGGTVLGGYSQPFNVPTREGIIFGNNATLSWPGLFVPASYTVAGLPSASANNRAIAWVSNGNAGAPCLAVSNGTSWLRIVPGTAVSAT